MASDNRIKNEDRQNHTPGKKCNSEWKYLLDLVLWK